MKWKASPADIDKAIGVLQLALKDEETPATVRMSLGNTLAAILMRRNRNAEAYEACKGLEKALVDVKPDTRYHTLSVLAGRYILLKHLDDAQRAIDLGLADARDDESEDHRMLFEACRGGLLLAQGKPAEALAVYLAATVEVPVTATMTLGSMQVRRWTAFTGAIDAAVAMRDVDRAMAILRDAAAACPDEANADTAVVPLIKKMLARGQDKDYIKHARILTCVPGQTIMEQRIAAEAQVGIVKALLRLRQNDAALAEGKRAFLTSPIQESGKALEVLVEVLNATEQGLKPRLMKFLEFQRLGGNGPDGKPHTADDLQDPLADIKLPVPAEYAVLDKIVTALAPTQCRQRGYAHMLKGEMKFALSEMRGAYAVEPKFLTDAAYAVATALKAVDGHTMRAVAYLKFQRYGPAGEDGRPRTGDDLTDPLDTVPIELPAKRVRELDQAIVACGDDYAGQRAKSMLLMVSGRSQEGLNAMRRAYRARPIHTTGISNAIMDVAMAIRALDGNVIRSNQYINFRKYGPEGKDGKAGTGDDLKNPLPPLPAD
jgi:tetratricopeptide (TPR) repeat protein